MKNKIALALILAALLSGISYAGVLDLSDSYTVDGAYIISGNTTYKIIYKTETYFDGQMLKRLVVEDQNRMEELQGSVDNMSSDISSMKLSVMEMASQRDKLKPEIEKSKSILDILKSQLNNSNTQMAALKQRQDDIKNLLTTNILFSQTGFNIAVIIFILLLVLVLFFKGFPYMSKLAGSESSGENSDKKGRNKKGELELIAREIEGDPAKINDAIDAEQGKTDDKL